MYKVMVCTKSSELPSDDLRKLFVFMDNDCYNVLYIEHDEKIIFTVGDGGEPEDNSFLRDYKWVKEQLEMAYKLGVSDGMKIGDVV